MIRTQAETAAQRLPPLQVEAQRVASTVIQGLHGRRRTGQGETFWQFRRYQPNDQIRRIDWRRSARDRHLYVRETEWEAAQSVWIWRDASASMRYRSQRNLPEKSERADILAMALAFLLADGGENVALLGANMPARSGHRGRDTFVDAMTLNSSTLSIPPAEPLPRHSTAVLIGDFLDPVPAHAEAIAILVAQGCNGHCLQVLDPAEETFPFDGRIRFEGAEQEEPHLLQRAAQVRDSYRQSLADHAAAMQDMTRAVGWNFARHHTGQPVEAALLSLYAALARIPVEREA